MMASALGLGLSMWFLMVSSSGLNLSMFLVRWLALAFSTATDLLVFSVFLVRWLVFFMAFLFGWLVFPMFLFGWLVFPMLLFGWLIVVFSTSMGLLMGTFFAMFHFRSLGFVKIWSLAKFPCHVFHN